jgi:hydrogenase-4 component E
VNVLIIILLFLALLLSRVTNLKTAVIILLGQSILVALACAIVAAETGAVHTYIAAALTLVIKAGLIPYALFRTVGMLRREREVNPILQPNYSAMVAGIMIVLAYGLTDKALPEIVSRDALAAAVAMMLIGLTMIMIRRQAVLQIVGLITMENGLYLIGLSVTQGLPLIIELGVVLDVMVAVVVLVILTYRLKRSFMSTDTSVLKKLKG